ncbi:MAG: ABC transporter ATP-binding protein [Rhodobacteraceae bacterium]|nr:MAG: ABC transporter ATP-binding protein [Paracoccaceae bacterium]
MSSVVEVKNLSKSFPGGLQALNNVNLTINQGEILALLGPNGAGKTTLISVICGICLATSGEVLVNGHDIITNYRETRKLIGLVPQDVSLEPFETVFNTVRFSRGLHGKSRNDGYLEKLLKQLSLWDKRNSKVVELSGGMKRRVLIAKALSHEPRLLFLDEPSAGVDVELRKDMWDIVAELQASGVTIVLTTHYIEEAEAIAERVGVISKGEILLVEEKQALMKRLGKKTLTIELQDPIDKIPQALGEYDLVLSDDGTVLSFTYDTRSDRTGITRLIHDFSNAGLQVKDLQTDQSSLEEIFVSLVQADKAKTPSEAEV